MTTPTVGFIVYGAHKGLKDPMGIPYINDELIEKSKITLINNGIKLKEHEIVVATKAEARDALKCMRDDDSVDCIILFTGTWIWAANLVAAIRDFARSGKGILIWTNPGPQGWRTGPGLLLHGALKEIGVKNKFIFGEVDDAKTIEQITSYCKASCLKNRLNMSTIGAFGGRGMGQTCGVADSSQWMRVFGVDIDTRDTTEIINRAKAISLDKIEALRSRLKEKIGQVPERSEANERSLRLYLAIKEVVENEGFDFYTVQCFPGLGEEYSITSFTQSMMLEDGIGTSSLGDFNTAMTNFLLTELSNESVFYGDIQNIDIKNNEMKVVSDGSAPPSLAGNSAPAQFAGRGIASEADGLTLSLVCKAGEGVVASLGRLNGEFQMVIAQCTVFEPALEQIQARRNECGIPFWPHAFVKLHCDVKELVEHWNSEYACLGYGQELYQNLIDFCELTGIKVILP